MGENKYFKTVVEVLIEDDKGKVKKIKEQYLVYANTPTDVESKINKHLEGESINIVQIVETKILSVIDE